MGFAFEVSVASSMPNYRITEHSKHLPNKQSFTVTLPGRITEETLAALTQEIAQSHLVGRERIFVHWWLESQDRDDPAEVCWAHSQWVDAKASFGINLLSFEEHLEAVEIRPLHDPRELGLWFWDCGTLSSYFHIIDENSDHVEVRRSFLDGTGYTERKKIISTSPMTIEWAEGESLQLDESALSIEAESGTLYLQCVRPPSRKK